MKTAKTVVFNRLGGPEVLEIKDLPIPEPDAGEVRLAVQAIGLNRADVMFRTGTYVEQPEFPSKIGIEAAGIIDAVGPGVTNVRIGDRICIATGESSGKYGTYGERIITRAASAIPYPTTITAEEAASVWVQYLTAYFAFVDLAHIQPGQSILLTAATGGAGLGAIQMARLLGATTIATTRSAAKKQALLDAGADHVIVTNDENLVERVRAITGGKGADLIFDCIAGDTLPTLAEAVAWGGQIIVYGALNGANVPYPLWPAFLQNFTLRSYMVYSFCGLATIGRPRNEEAFARAVKFINEMLATSKLKPAIARTFPLSQIQEAHRFMESNQHSGKIVVTV